MEAYSTRVPALAALARWRSLPPSERTSAKLDDVARSYAPVYGASADRVVEAARARLFEHEADALAREPRGAGDTRGHVLVGALIVLLLGVLLPLLLLEIDARNAVRACGSDMECVEAERRLFIPLDVLPLCIDCDASINYAEGK